jgi:hypothetical protein
MATKKDFTQVAFAVFQQATGAAPKPSPKDPTAVAAGRKGGMARKSAMSEEDRREAASKAAKSRWAKKTG